LNVADVGCCVYLICGKRPAVVGHINRKILDACANVSSGPLHYSRKLAEFSFAGSVFTWLAGGVLSTVFIQVGVLIGAFASNTTVAWF